MTKNALRDIKKGDKITFVYKPVQGIPTWQETEESL